MFKQLEIKNFRSHKNTILDFTDGVNVIVGLPDSGKTNIIRSINWILTNRPLGFRFHSDFTDDDTKVSLSFNDGNTITLTKNKKSSEYSYNDNEKMKAIGSEVPDVISKAANVTELTLQKQLDKPFLITATPGEVAKVFNRITKLEKIDAVSSLMTTDINSENKKIRQLELQEEDLKKQIFELGDLIAMEHDAEIIQNVVKDFDTINRKYQSLSTIVDEIDRCDIELKKLGKISAKAEEELSEIEKLVKGIKDYEALYEDVDSVIGIYNDNFDKTELYKDKLNKKVKEFEDFMLSNEDAGCPFCEKCNQPFSNHHFADMMKEYKI